MGKKGASPNLFDEIWNFFSSVKLTVVLLLSLAVTSIIGTLIPQNEDPASYYQAFGDFWYRIFHVLDIFDMYHAWWFQLLLLLLTLNVVVCSIDRLSATWKIVFTRTPKFNVSRFRQLSNRSEFSLNRSLEKLEEIFTALARRTFSFSTVEKNRQ
jgi:cytochrome c biogenesis protein